MYSPFYLNNRKKRIAYPLLSMKAIWGETKKRKISFHEVTEIEGAWTTQIKDEVADVKDLCIEAPDDLKIFNVDYYISAFGGISFQFANDLIHFHPPSWNAPKTSYISSFTPVDVAYIRIEDNSEYRSTYMTGGFANPTKAIIYIDGAKMDDRKSTAAGGHHLGGIRFDEKVKQTLVLQLVDLGSPFPSVPAWIDYFDNFEIFDDANIHRVLAEFLDPLFASRKVHLVLDNSLFTLPEMPPPI